MNYVSSILGGAITIESVGEYSSPMPHDLPSPTDLNPVITIPFNGEAELARLLEKLRDSGVAFGYGSSGWPPSAIFEELRQRGLVAGPYAELAFVGSGKWTTRTR
jgi:hypothetical protein